MSTSTSADTIPPVTSKPTEEQVKEFKRRLFETASRSYINDRLHVNLPDDLHGEWIGIDDFSQYHANLKGFVDGSSYLTAENQLFQRPDGSTLGDVKFMVIPKWKYDAMQEIAQLESARKAGLRGKAETDAMYSQYAQSIGLPELGESSFSRSISGKEIDDLLNKR
jgi:hypothetical protein